MCSERGALPDWIGYGWLIEHYGLTVAQPLRVQTAIGPTRTTLVSFGFVHLHPMINGNGRISRFLITTRSR